MILVNGLSLPLLRHSRQLLLLAWEMQLMTTPRSLAKPMGARGTLASHLLTILLINMSVVTTVLGIWLRGLTIPSQSLILT